MTVNSVRQRTGATSVTRPAVDQRMSCAVSSPNAIAPIQTPSTHAEGWIQDFIAALPTLSMGTG